MTQSIVLAVIVGLTLYVLCNNLAILLSERVSDTIRKACRIAFVGIMTVVASVSWTAASAINSEIPDVSKIKYNESAFSMEVVKVNNP